jgi:two-component system chemotaxis response regulator CheV
MSSLSNILLDKEILLESGTNELELLVFDVADYTFGINVAKVREVLPTTEITALPKAHPSIRGVFKLRNQVIPCVSLITHLGIAATAEPSESTLILTDFNQQQTGFLVDSVDRIFRLSWENILSVPGLEALSHTPVTALARCEDRLIVMLDFEMVLDDVTNQYFRTDEVANPSGLPREQLRILLAEDSPTVREAIGETLNGSGYTQLTFFENGQEAWKWIDQRINQTQRVEDVADLIIADVEMPQVDGFHLTKKIKSHPALKQVPVLLYSSIITPDNQKKGKAVGADAQVSKPELNEVVRLADELISTAQRDNRAKALREVTGAAQAEVEKCETQSGTTAASPTAEASQPAAAAAPTAEPTPQPSAPTAETTPAHESPQPAPAPKAAADSSTAPSGPPAEAPAERPGQPEAAEPAVPQAEAPQKSFPIVPPPASVSAKIWTTFHRELCQGTEALLKLVSLTEKREPSEEIINQLMRTLHTIKSAAMVVPLNQISHCTHLMESIIEAAHKGHQPWDQASLVKYVAWLQSIAVPPIDVNISLENSATVANDLQRAIKGSAGA